MASETGAASVPAVQAAPAAVRRRQLRMWRPHLEDLPPLATPTGYALRTFRPGDERGWGEIMACDGGLGRDWSEARVHESMVSRQQFDAAGMFLIASEAEGGRLVASATAWHREDQDPATGNVHMVCALPEHRGRGIGRLVTLAVLYRLKERGFTSADLDTDDFRLSAVKTYLGLGFIPLYLGAPSDNLHARWSAVFTQLLQPR